MPFTPRKISDNFDKLPFHEDEKALLRGCLETPWDDAPFLVYADWVEEHGEEERAEFIREQVRTGGLAEWGDVPKQAKKWAEKFFPRKQSKYHNRFVKGLPSHWNLHGQILPKMMEEMKDISWDFCFSISYTGMGELEQKFLYENPRFSQISSVELTQPYLYSGSNFEQSIKVINNLASSPNAASIHSLSYFGPLGQQAAISLQKAPFIQQLQTLKLRISSTNMTLNDWSVLFENCEFTNLKQLCLIGDKEVEFEIDSIFKLKSLSQLQSLTLFVGMDVEGLKKLSKYGEFANLNRLDLSGNNFGNDGFDLLGKSKSFPMLDKLYLKYDDLDDPDLSQFLKGSLGTQLKSLSLAGNSIGNDFLVDLAQFEDHHLDELDLSHSPCSSKGVAGLVSGPFVSPLKRLYLLDVETDLKAINSILSSDYLTNLQFLGLTNYKITPAASKKLKKVIKSKPFKLIDKIPNSRSMWIK